MLINFIRKLKTSKHKNFSKTTYIKKRREYDIESNRYIKKQQSVNLVKLIVTIRGETRKYNKWNKVNAE